MMSPNQGPPTGSGASSAADGFWRRLQQELQRTQKPQTAAPAQPVTKATEEQTETTGPVGQGDYEVRPGDCISSIAKEHGFFWRTIWDDAANADLQQVRQDPNVLLPGDRVTIPEKQRKDESISAEMRHHFRRKGEPAKLRLRLLQGPARIDADSEQAVQSPGADAADKPRTKVPYRLIVDGKTSEGKSDNDGWVICSIPGDAKRGTLILEPGTADEQRIELDLGHVAPLSEVRGVRQRLRNLGFDVEPHDSDEMSPRLKHAIRAFQAQNRLDATGKLDERTRQKLLEVHGC